jgi:hypothetical protein
MAKQDLPRNNRTTHQQFQHTRSNNNTLFTAFFLRLFHLFPLLFSRRHRVGRRRTTAAAQRHTAADARRTDNVGPVPFFFTSTFTSLCNSVPAEDILEPRVHLIDGVFRVAKHHVGVFVEEQRVIHGEGLPHKHEHRLDKDEIKPRHWFTCTGLTNERHVKLHATLPTSAYPPARDRFSTSTAT